MYHKKIICLAVVALLAFCTIVSIAESAPKPRSPRIMTREVEVEKAKKKQDKFLGDENTKKALLEFKNNLDSLDKFDHEGIENACRNAAEKYNIKAAAIIHPTRVAISGKTVGAGLFEMMELLGKEKVVKRLSKVI